MHFFKKTDFRKKKKVISHHGYSFASKMERDLFDYLKLLEKAKEISNIKLQVSVYLTEARILYKPDFSYEKENETIYAEMKGFETAVWRIKRRLWKHYGPGILEVYKTNRSGVYLHETIIPVYP